jgi:CBS domain-containing protein
VALVVGLGMLLGVDTILASMALGAVLVNLAPRRSKRAFDMVQRFASPIYVLFFVIVGAGLHIWKMPTWMWVLVAPYVLARAFGKAMGAYLGAKLTHAAETVRKYLGLCLLCQGGVAVGLAILASKRFVGEAEEIGVAIIAVIAVSTLIVEILGPPCVKLAVTKAGEVGLNVTEEDLMASYRVGDMADKSCPTFQAETPLAVVLKTIAETDEMAYPVVSDDGTLAGIVTIQELKRSFGGEGLAQWLVAYDLMQPAPDTVTEDTPLAEAMTRMREQELDYLPVLAAEDDPRLVGMLELRTVSRSISHEILRRRELADA